MDRKKKVLSVFGTRPEAIKMAPVVQALHEDPDIDAKVALTAQHRQMLDQVIDLFSLPVHHDLNLMQERQTLEGLTGRVLTQLKPVLEEEKPDLVLVHGDTTTTMAASLAAFYQQIPVGHVEAGLRTDKLYDPFPEEMNRRVTSRLTRLHFAPTPQAVHNLQAEGITDGLFQTGNTVIDALLQTVAKKPPLPFDLPQGRMILVTAHRRENWGIPMQRLCQAFLDTLEAVPDSYVVFPVHLNPVVRETVLPLLQTHPRVILTDPLDYAPFSALIDAASLVLTDSGGIQEEAPSLGKPVLVLRETTERPEAIDAGTVKLVGTQRNAIATAAIELLTNPDAYLAMANAVNPYGDGLAAKRIREAIRGFVGLPVTPIAPFDPLPHGRGTVV